MDTCISFGKSCSGRRATQPKPITLCRIGAVTTLHFLLSCNIQIQNFILTFRSNHCIWDKYYLISSDHFSSPGLSSLTTLNCWSLVKDWTVHRTESKYWVLTYIQESHYTWWNWGFCYATSVGNFDGWRCLNLNPPAELLSKLTATVSGRWGKADPGVQLVIDMHMGLIRSKVFLYLFGPQQRYLFHFNDNCSLHNCSQPIRVSVTSLKYWT